MPQNAAELGKLEGFGRVGRLFRPVTNRGETILQGDQSLATLELGLDVGPPLIVLREPVEAATGRGRRFAESPECQQRLAPCRVRHPEPRFDPDGRLVMADRLVQPVRVARGQAKAGAGERGVRVNPQGRW